MAGFETRTTAKQYAAAHFPLDWKEVLTPEEFAPWVNNHPIPLGIIEYSIGVMIGCL